MKKFRILKAFAFAAALALAVPGCSDLTDSSGKSAVAENGTIAVTLSAKEAYRTIISDLPSDLTYTLSVTQNGTAVRSVELESLSEDAVVYLSAGSYTFTLTGSDAEGNAVVSGSTTKDITSENATVSITLTAVTGEAVDVTLTLDIPNADSYGVDSVEAVVYDDAGLSSYSQNVKDTLTGSKSEDGVWTLTGSLVSGADKFVQIKLKDSEKELLGSKVEQVFAIAGSSIEATVKTQVQQYKATVKLYLKEGSEAPEYLTLKNSAYPTVTGQVKTSSTESPYVYTGYVDVRSYDVYNGDSKIGTISNSTVFELDETKELTDLSAAWTDGSQPVIYANDSASENIKKALTVTASIKDKDGIIASETISDYTLSAPSLDTYDAQTLTVTYSYNGTDKTAEVSVTLTKVELASIEIKTAPTSEKTYYVGDIASDIDLTGLVLSLTNNDGSTSEVEYSDTIKDDFSAAIDSSEAGEEKNVTVTYGGKSATYTVTVITKFTSFVASEDIDKTSDSSSYETITTKDGLITMGRTKYQANVWSTYDYNEDSSTGYTYTARVKVNKTSGSDKGTFTISNVKPGSIFRIDGGNASGSGVRELSFTGTDSDSTNWAASACGSFYVTATDSTVVLTSLTNEFCIYGIHIVSEKVSAAVANVATTYSKPELTLSETSVAKDTEVTISASIPDATVTTTNSDGTVTSSTQAVSATLSYKKATVENGTAGTYSDVTISDGKVDTSTEGTFAYTVSYTIGEGDSAKTYTSGAVTLEVTGAFASSSQTVTNDEATLGLTATSVESSDTGVATVTLNNGIVITSVTAGTATITFTDGTNSGTIAVTVGAGGDITYTVNKYSLINTVTWALSSSSELTGTSTLANLTATAVTGYSSNSSVTWADENSKFKYDGDTSPTSVATFTTNLKSSAADCISNGNYAEIVITNNTGKSVTLSKLEYTHSIKDKNSGYGCQAFYWIGDATYNKDSNAGTALTASTYGSTSAILTKAEVEFGSDVTVESGKSVTIRFAYYGGNNGSKVCALKDVVLTVK